MSLNEKDFDEKLAFRALLWKKGYTVFLNVPVFSGREENGDLKRDDITDVDVLGFSFDDTLVRRLELADCKSNPDSHNRLLWLGGLKQFLRADRSSFVSRRINQRFSRIAKTLDIDLWTIEEIHRVLKAQEFDLSGGHFDSKLVAHHAGLLAAKNFKGNKQKFVSLLSYKFWEIPRPHRLQTLLHDFAVIANELDGSDADRALVFDALKKISLTLLEIGSFVVQDISQDVHRLTEQFLFGFPEEIERKKALNKAHGLPESSLYPKYYSELLELVNVIVRRPDCAKELCRILEIYYFDPKLVENEISLATKDDGRKNFLVTIKQLKDVVGFVQVAVGLKKPLLEDLFRI